MPPIVLALTVTAVLLSETALAQDDLEAMLLRAHGEYVGARATSSIEALVKIDAQLRRLNDDRPRIPLGALATLNDLGLSFSRHGDTWYTGKLLLEAHSLNPGSRYRQWTLFATVWPDGGHRHLAPKPSAAEAYLSEFPDGPFADETRLILARFYGTLSELLRYLANGWTTAPGSPPRTLLDVRYDCYAPLVTAGQYAEQRRRALEAGLTFYRQLAARRTTDLNLLSELKALEGSTFRTYYCFEHGS